MIKAVQILNESTEESLFCDDRETENVMEKLDSIDLNNIHLVRCAVHTLQLCVFDVNKAKEISDKISACRTLSKSLRTETNRYVLYSIFYILWMELKLKCENSHNFIKKKLLAQIKVRETKLLENEVMLAAIYMDPRVNCMLSNDQKVLAKKTLKIVACRLIALKQVSCSLYFDSNFCPVYCWYSYF